MDFVSYETESELVHEIEEAFRCGRDGEERGGGVDDAAIELEARWKTVQPDGSLVSGVSQTTFDRVDRLLSSYEGWSMTKDWTESHDFFVPDLDDRVVRMGVEFDSDSLRVRKDVVHKRTIRTFEARTPSCTAIRFAITREARVPYDALPRIVRPRHVRIKRRRSFWYTSSTCESTPMFRYDLTTIWSGHTKAEAEAWQRSDRPPIYEIEVEYTGGVECLSIVGSARVVRSMLMKCADLLYI